MPLAERSVRGQTQGMQRPPLATRRLVFPMLCAVLACGATTPVAPAAPPPPPPAGTAVRLLFAGNSLTYWHEIPELVKRLAVAAGKTAPVVLDRSAPNYGLEDHWTEGTVQRDLESGAWTLLIMQQGPSTLPESGVNLMQWVGNFATKARAHGTRPAVFATWAPAGAAFQDGVTHYRAAADAAKSAFYPASEAWLEAWRLDPQIPLYSKDDFHPSPTGSLLAALVITATIYDVDATTLPNILSSQVTAAHFAILQSAAHTAIVRSGRQ